eukprot:6441473-Amphidinium_carterae.2
MSQWLSTSSTSTMSRQQRGLRPEAPPPPYDESKWSTQLRPRPRPVNAKNNAGIAANFNFFASRSPWGTRTEKSTYRNPLSSLSEYALIWSTERS